MSNKALGIIADKCNIAGDASFTARNRSIETPKPLNYEMKGYHEGKASAFNDAHAVMKAELRRLYFKFANGSLTAEDFGVDP